MAIDKNMIAEIKTSTNIVDVIGEVVKLTKTGRQYSGLCPFHKEKTPSFSVVEDRQFFRCFGCGKSGDVFKFLEEYRQISFLEAAALLAERAGIALSLPQQGQTQRQQSPHQHLYDINADASNFYHAVLMTTTAGEQARQYLYKRGLTDDHLRYFKIGLAPDEPDYLYQAMSKKYDEETCLSSGLFNLTETNRIFDGFRNRIMFPLTDDRGRFIGFSGRIWTEQASQEHQAKYKNTRSTPIFNKSYELYHLDRAKPVIQKTHEVYLMEGFMDAIAAYRAGLVNSVASMGTALTAEHVRHLKKLTKKVVLSYDGDAAGQNAIAKSLELLKDFEVEIVRLPEQMDPDDFLQAHSEEELANYLTQSRMTSTEFWLYHLRPQNIDNLRAQINYVEQLSPLIAKVPSLTAQNSYITKMADFLPDFDYRQLEEVVNQERLRQRGQVSETQDSGYVLTNQPLSKALTALLRTENQLFHRLLHHAHLLNEYRLREDFRFETAELETLYQLLQQEGEIGSFELSQLSEPVQSAYYQMLEEPLPDDVADGEMQALEARREQLLAEQELRKQSKHIRESSHHGDIDTAVMGLDALIAQRRRLEE